MCTCTSMCNITCIDETSILVAVHFSMKTFTSHVIHTMPSSEATSTLTQVFSGHSEPFSCFDVKATKSENKPEDHWSCIAHLSAEDMLKSAVIEEKKFKHSPRVGADNPLGPKF